MAQQETYGNWLGPKRLVRQPGIYSMAGKVSPVTDFRPASPDSFEDDYDDVSMAGSDRGPPAKGVYLLAGPPGSAPNDPDPKSPNLDPKSPNLTPNFEAPDPNLGDFAPKSANLTPKFGGWVPVSVLALLSALAWAGITAAALGKYQELRAELESLRSNLSGIRDSVQQEQTRLQFGIHQHQQELQELSDLLCHSGQGSRRCPAGWQSLGSSCYSFSRDSLSWARAHNACGDLGAHLVVVNSEEEQAFLLEQSERGARYWLGVTDGEHEGSWRWVTGDSNEFRFWDVWAQDPERELKDCGAIGPRGLWVNERCSEFLRWICEKPGNC